MNCQNHHTFHSDIYCREMLMIDLRCARNRYGSSPRDPTKLLNVGTVNGNLEELKMEIWKNLCCGSCLCHCVQCVCQWKWRVFRFCRNRRNANKYEPCKKVDVFVCCLGD